MFWTITQLFIGISAKAAVKADRAVIHQEALPILGGLFLFLSPDIQKTPTRSSSGAGPDE